MYKTVISFLGFCFLLSCAQAQNFTGQWKGTFKDISNLNNWEGNTSEYVLDMVDENHVVTGKSYTYFTAEGKRYYSICAVEGKANVITNEVKIIEVKRLKTNIPSNIINRLQIHKLSLKKRGNKYFLEGTWQPKNEEDKKLIGYGTTQLEKRILQKPIAAVQNKTPQKNPFNKQFATKQAANTKPILAFVPPTNSKVAAKSNPAKKEIATAVVIPKTTIADTDEKQIKSNLVNITVPSTSIDFADDIANFEKRKINVLQTLLVKNDIINVELYDNGEIDGDSVSIFFNGKLLVTKKKLFIEPIRLSLKVQDGTENELTMFAENLGTIPPNTALMVIMDGKKRHEVRVVSDLSKSGTVKFVKEALPD
jgi:archaellum component FlaF (FlaF/FlaG flagellin family)